MGEYADYEIDRMLDEEWGFYRPSYKPKPPRCKFCKATGLFWQLDMDETWFLAEWDSGEWVKHTCKMTKFPTKLRFTPERAYAALVHYKTLELMNVVEVGMGLTQNMARSEAIELLKKAKQIPDDYK